MLEALNARFGEHFRAVPEAWHGIIAYWILTDAPGRGQQTDLRPGHKSCGRRGSPERLERSRLAEGAARIGSQRPAGREVESVYMAATDYSPMK
jgi:hypothetical protein